VSAKLLNVNASLVKGKTSYQGKITLSLSNGLLKEFEFNYTFMVLFGFYVPIGAYGFATT